MSKANYIKCSESEIPSGVRFDVPGPNQGQIVEVAWGGFDRGEHGAGDPYKRVTDRSLAPHQPGYRTYYRRAPR